LRYGSYREAEFEGLLKRCRAMIFLCEHETQGLAYQQALSAGVPILAWDRGGYWQDPTYYPARAKYGPVSSVPYWDERCGTRFSDIKDFESRLEVFLAALTEDRFHPREFILEGLTLEACAQKYVEIWRTVREEL
jgi:glycosyltransferase involved in cell wall biosynthesis